MDLKAKVLSLKVKIDSINRIASITNRISEPPVHSSKKKNLITP